MRPHFRRSSLCVVLLLFANLMLIGSGGSSRSGESVGESRYEADRALPSAARGASIPGNADDARARVKEAYGRLPLRFEANHGQMDARIKFAARTKGYGLFLTGEGAAMLLQSSPVLDGAGKPAPESTMRAGKVALVRMKIAGADPKAKPEGVDELAGISNYFFGNDSAKWHTGVPGYRGVRYEGIYPGIDLMYHANPGHLEYDFIVAPGADPNSIKLAFRGIKRLRVTESGDLLLQTSLGDVRQQKPILYQEDEDGTRRIVAGGYVRRGRNRIGFEVRDYDRTKALVIDPVLSYSTYLGGTSGDQARDIAIDADGNAYITGWTSSFNFPTTIDAFDTTFSNSTDVFVTKLNATGTDIIYSTYLGGTSQDQGLGVVVGGSGNAYVTGLTTSTAFPTTPGAYRTTFQGGFSTGDAFVTKLNPMGTALEYSTFLGGNSEDQGAGIAIDALSNAYIVGGTSSTNFPTTPGAYQTTNGGGGFLFSDAFITKLNPDGTDLVYSTFLGGSSQDQGLGIHVDDSGSAYVTGATGSTDFDVTGGAFQTTYGGQTGFTNFGDAFITKLNGTGTALLYSTYLGGAGDDGGLGIVVNSSDEAFVTGSTSSHNFPTTPGVLRAIGSGVAKTANGGGSWFAANGGMARTNVLALAIDPMQTNTVYAGTFNSGIFKTTDGGLNWAAINSDLTDLMVLSIAVNPATTSTLYLGTNSRGVFRSTDGGASWRGVNTGQNGPTVNALTIDPMSPLTVYAATSAGLFRTTNGGANWTGLNTGLPSFRPARSFAMDPATPSTLYVGIDSSGVFRSTDGGSSWKATALNNFTPNALAIDPSVPTTLYASHFNGVLKTTDAGASWQGINAGLTERTAMALHILSADPSIIHVATTGGVFRSTDAGANWGPLNLGLLGAIVNALAVDPADAAIIYAGTSLSNTDAFVTRLNSTGSGLEYSTLLGGNNNDRGNAIGLDGSGNVLIAGGTTSSTFPTTKGAFRKRDFSLDGFVARLNAAGLVYSTAISGVNEDEGFGLAANASGNAYVAGFTFSRDFPVTPGAYQPLLNNTADFNFNNDGFVSKIVGVPNLSADLSVAITGPAGPLIAGSSVQYTITVTNDGPDTASGVTIRDDLPSSVLFSFCSGLTFCTHSGNSVIFVLNTLDQGDSQTFTIFTNVNCSIASNTQIINKVTVDSSAFDPDPTDNSASVTTAATNPTLVSPQFQVFAPGGGTASLNVFRTAPCPWSSTSNDPWITILFSSGFGNGVVNYSVAPNPGPTARLGTMTVAGLTFTVIQAAVDADSDSDGVPDTIEVSEGLNPLVKDNNIFGNARLFVMQQYRDFLGREGDAGGVTFWTDRINSGGVTRAQMVNNFFNSAEFQNTTAPVTRLYFAFFLRIPDTGGLNFWVNQFKNGVPLSSIADAFAQSAEFQARYGTLNNTEFVTLVYNNVLGREPDPAGLAFWVGQLDSGALNRGQVMLNFSESTEYRALIANEVFVTQIYIGMLKRAPDQGGFDFWVGLLDSGASGLTLIQEFLDSVEYHNRFLPPV